MPGPAERLLDGQRPGWSGRMRNLVAVTAADGTVYDPPLRMLLTGTAGALVVLLDGDDENNNTISAVTPSGTTPPTVTITGTPLAAVSTVKIDIIVGGALTVATFQWSIDNGTTFSGTLPTAATFVIPGSGLTVGFSVGTYNADNLYTATSSNPAWATITTTANGERLRGFAIRQVRKTGTAAANILGFR